MSLTAVMVFALGPAGSGKTYLAVACAVNALERDQVKRVWFDGPNSYELAVSGETVKFVQELNMFYQKQPALRPLRQQRVSKPFFQ